MKFMDPGLDLVTGLVPTFVRGIGWRDDLFDDLYQFFSRLFVSPKMEGCDRGLRGLLDPVYTDTYPQWTKSTRRFRLQRRDRRSRTPSDHPNQGGRCRIRSVEIPTSSRTNVTRSGKGVSKIKNRLRKKKKRFRKTILERDVGYVRHERWRILLDTNLNFFKRI